MKPTWLNRTVIGAGLTSFLADASYELATALLPSFLMILGLPQGQAAQVLGAIEAAAEFISNAAKLLVGWWSDRIGKRKALVVFGYALTGVAFALCAVAVSWPLVMLAKSLGWLGKGIRGPLRNAIITDSVDPAHRGKAFGFHRAGDTFGAVLGPLLAAFLLLQISGSANHPTDVRQPYVAAFWFTLVPGMGAAITFWLLVREQRFNPKPGLRLGASLSAMPTDYRRFLVCIFLFGMGDFSHTLLILVASQYASPELTSWIPNIEAVNPVTRAAIAGILLYAWRNLVQAVAAFPAGWLGDRFGHRQMLILGYLLGAATMCGFATIVRWEQTHALGWLLLFAFAGVYMAIQESLEPAMVADFVPDKQLHGTAYGVLAVVNGLGDVLASLVVGWLVLMFGWSIGLGYAAAAMTLGAIGMAARIRTRSHELPARN
jgi:MFS family permease